MFQKTAEPPHGLREGFLVRQEHYPEMIRVLPVKAGSLHQQQALFFQKIHDELFIIADVKAFRVNFGETVEGAFGHDRGKAGDSVGHVEVVELLKLAHNDDFACNK